MNVWGYTLISVIFCQSLAIAGELDNVCKRRPQQYNQTDWQYAKQNAQAAQDSKDPCVEADLKESAVDPKYVSSAVYATGSVTCLTECVNDYGGGHACAIAGVAGFGTELYGSQYVENKSKELVSKLAGAKGALGDLGITGKSDMLGPVNSEGVIKNQGACTASLSHGIKSTGEFVDANQLVDEAEELRRKKLLALQKNAPTLNTSTGSAEQEAGGAATPGSIESAFNRGETGDEENEASPTRTGQSLAEFANRNGTDGPLKKFEKLTGKPASELFDRMLAGQNPVAAAAEMAKDALGPKGLQMAAAIASAAPAIVDEMKEKTPATDKAVEFADSASGAKSKPKDDSLGDLQSMISGLMPKKKKEKESKALSELRLSARKPAAKNKEIQETTKSIFEVVGDRYQKVVPRILSSSGGA